MLNPGARPWYPMGDAMSDVPASPLHWRNCTYTSSATQQQPPIPLCGDSDLGSIQLSTLSDAALPTPVVPAPSGEGPYRSTALPKQDTNLIFEPCRRGQQWKPNSWLSDSTQLRHTSRTLSSRESFCDLQEVITPLHVMKTKTHYGAAARTTTSKVIIPLPRSRRQEGSNLATQSTSDVKTAFDACAAAPTITTTTPTESAADAVDAVDAAAATGTTNISHVVINTPIPTSTPTTNTSSSVTTYNNDSAIVNTNAEDKKDYPVNTGAVSDSANVILEDKDTRNIEHVPSSGKKETGGTSKQLSIHLQSGPTTATKKQKTKTKREEKWTIVQGKSGTDFSSQTQFTAAKKSTAVSAVAKVRENGAVICLTEVHSMDKMKIKQHQQKEKDDEDCVKNNAIVESKTKRLRDVRRTKGSSKDDELLERIINGAELLTASKSININNSSNSYNNSNNVDNLVPVGDKSGSVVIMGVPLAGISRVEQLLPSSHVPARYKTAFRIFLRSLAMTEASNVKALLLHRALRGLPESSYHQFPELVCAILLETSDNCADVEKSLQTCYKALQLAESHKLDLFDMLARLAITRTFARVIDTMDARVNLTRAATIAIVKNEKAALGWIAMQMGVTLEISGMFPESLAWYEAAERLAEDTKQPQLLCDIYCCKSIAFSAIGELELAHQAYESSRTILPFIPRHRHQRPLQNYAQLKCQLGDMLGALKLQETELEITKELGDMQAASRCMGAIALTKRFLCRYEEAAENHMEELSVYNPQDPRQIIESLTGAAACWRLGGHLEKAYDYSVRALRQAQQCQDLTTLAKALVELAEAELSLNMLDKAEQHLRESLATVARVDEAEQKQYLVKAALCEVEWRCCSILEQVHFRRGEIFEALQWSDRCRVPNTAQVARLLLRRQRRAGVTLDSTSDVELVSRSLFESLLRKPGMREWKIVCYSLPWNEGLDFMVYVFSLDKNENLTCVVQPLCMHDELIAVVCAPSALSELLDAPMYTEEGVRIYGDTPLWPQLYSKVVFDFQQNSENAERLGLLKTDVHYCLRLLHDGFIKPLEAEIKDATGLIFVGDGVFSRLPFHAFYDGERYLAQRYCTTTCCSMALLCTHFAEECVEEGKDRRNGLRQCTIVDDSANRTTLLDAYFAKAVAEGISVHRVVIDECITEKTCDKLKCDSNKKVNDVGTGGDETGGSALSNDANIAATQHLLRSLYRHGKVKSVRNALYRAVHEVVAGDVLELRLRAVPEVREDYCGSFVGASSEVIASQSSEVANTWDLRRYSLVMCTGAGTYSGLSIHETGIPVYRSLQYAGARRMLLATGSRVPTSDRVPAAAATATVATARGLGTVAKAVREAHLQCISEHAPLADWAGFSLVGLP